MEKMQSKQILSLSWSIAWKDLGISASLLSDFDQGLGMYIMFVEYNIVNDLSGMLSKDTNLTSFNLSVLWI